jgi:tetratricopeptide (TPR) repeat protein
MVNRIRDSAEGQSWNPERERRGVRLGNTPHRSRSGFHKGEHFAARSVKITEPLAEGVPAMRFLLVVVALVPALVSAAPVPKGTKGSWVGKPAFLKGPNVRLTTVLANGTERKVAIPQGTYSYVVTKVTEDRVEVLYGTGKLTAYFNRDDVLRGAEAIDYHTAALSQNAKDAYHLTGRAEANAAEGKLDAAEADYALLLASDPNNLDFRVKRAAFRMTAKRFEQAIEDYEKLGELNANYKEWSLQRTAEAKAGLKKFDEALADLTKALENSQNRTGLLLSRGIMYSRAGKHDKSLEDYEEILKTDPNNAVAINNIAWLKATCPDAKYRDGKAAVEQATKACELTQWKNAGHIDTLAAAYAEAGDFEKAVKYQTDVVNDEALVRREGDELKERLELYKQKKPYRLPDETKKK